MTCSVGVPGTTAWLDMSLPPCIIMKAHMGAGRLVGSLAGCCAAKNCASHLSASAVLLNMTLVTMLQLMPNIPPYDHYDQRRCCMSPLDQLEWMFKMQTAPSETAAIIIEPILGAAHET